MAPVDPHPAGDSSGSSEGNGSGSGDQIPAECVVYFSPGRSPVSLLNRGSEMEIACPADTAMFIDMAVQGIGASVYRSVPFEADLTLAEAVVLGAIIDLQRKAALKAIAVGQVPAAVDCPAAAIHTLISHKDPDNRWLRNVLFDILSLEGISSE